MMFRGTKNRTAAEYERVMTVAGAHHNAYTDDDYTNFFATFSKESVDEILKIEADRFQNLSYSIDAFQTEARAVKGEYQKNSAQPAYKLREAERFNAFRVHPYQHTPMGLVSDVDAMPNQFDYSLKFFSQWYRPEHTTLVIAGDVVPSEVIALCSKYFGGWKRGTFAPAIPQEPPAAAPRYAHVAWPAPTLPLLRVAVRGPAFSETKKDFAAMSLVLDLHFGPNSRLFKSLVEDRQWADTLAVEAAPSQDPGLMVISARLSKASDAVRVRDELLAELVRARTERVAASRLADAVSRRTRLLMQSLDSTEHVAGAVAEFARFRRTYDTLNNVSRLEHSLTPDDLLAAAGLYIKDQGLVVTTLSHEPLPEGISVFSALSSYGRETRATSEEVRMLLQPSALALLNLKLSFATGSACDPVGKEGLAQLSASMMTEAGSKYLRSDEVTQALYPLAASFSASVDKEVTRFNGVVTADVYERFAEAALPMLIAPAFRDEDFNRLRTHQLNQLTSGLRANSDETLAKEVLSTSLYKGTPYGHPVLGTVTGLRSLTLDDVKAFVARYYTRSNLLVGVAGNASEGVLTHLKRALQALPVGEPVAPLEAPRGRRPVGLEVELVKKQTASAAISIGLPLEVTRSNPEFAALDVARSWLGEHRSWMSHLLRRMREARGLNYGSYAYVEAFPNGENVYLPEAGVPRRSQLFELWVRPVAPENAHFALRLALFEVAKLLREGLSKDDFENTRAYLMKNVFVVTAQQEQALGFALDAQFYGTGGYAETMRERLAKLTVDDVNRAIRAHWSAENLKVVIVTQDTEGLKRALLSDEFSKVTYDSPKAVEVLEEDKEIGAFKLGLRPGAITVTPLDEVFMK